MSDLAGFLAARLGEDEETAKAAIAESACAHCESRSESTHRSPAGEWRINPDHAPLIEDAGNTIVYNDDAPSINEHIARHDPARVLREVAAKREVVERYEEARDRNRELSDGTAHDGRDPDEAERDEDIEAVLEDMLRLLASAWSDHPDYDPAWAIENITR